MPKVKDKENLKSSKRKSVSYPQGSSHKIVWFFNRNFAEGIGPKYSKWWKARNYNQDYPAKPSFRIDGYMKSFSDKKNLKEFITTKLVFCELLKMLKKEKGEEENKKII